MKPFFALRFVRCVPKGMSEKKGLFECKITKILGFSIYLHFNLDRPTRFQMSNVLMKHNILIRFVVAAAYNCHSRFILCRCVVARTWAQSRHEAKIHKSQMNTQKPQIIGRIFSSFFGCHDTTVVPFLFLFSCYIVR